MMSYIAAYSVVVHNTQANHGPYIVGEQRGFVFTVSTDSTEGDVTGNGERGAGSGEREWETGK